MKKKYLIFFSLIIWLFSCNYKKENLPVIEPLFWEYSDSINAQQWSPAKVPGDIQQSLSFNLFLWKNFYLDRYVEKISWLSHKTWFYRTKINVDQKTYKEKEFLLIFNGLDTYTKIYINGKLLAQTNDFYKRYQFNIKEYIQQGKNTITLQFSPPLETAQEFYKSLDYKGKASPFSVLRKPWFHFNKDLSTNYIPIGFNGDAQLILWEKARIEDTQFYFSEIDSNKARCKVVVKINSTKNQKARLSIESQYAIYINQKVRLKPGKNTFTFVFDIPSPKLWYPTENENIKPNTYKFTTALYIGQTKYDEKEKYTGIRKVQFETENNQLNLKINDSTILLKAAVIYPLGINRAQENDLYDHFLSLIKQAGFNTVIVSDKGWYYNDKFYTLCDLNGIMVIQNLPIAYKAFPPRDTIVNLIISETIQNIKNLRNHPSIIAWNGNFNSNQIKDTDKQTSDFAKKFFTQIIPLVIKNIDSGRTYLTNLDFKNSITIQHNTIAFPSNKITFKFLELADVRANKDSIFSFYAKPSEQTYYRQIQEVRKKFPADSVEKLIYFSQLYQKQQILKKLKNTEILTNKHIIVNWFNDITPGISPAYVDNNLIPRAQFYALNQLLTPFRITTDNKGNNVSVTITTDYDTASVLAYYKLYDFYGHLLWQKVFKEEIQNHKLTKNFDLGIYFKLFSRDTILMKIEVYNNLELVAEKYHYFIDPDKIKLKPPKLNIAFYPIDNGYAIELTPQNYLTKDVQVIINQSQTIIEKNFFDILPGESKIITIRTAYQPENFASLIHIYSKYDYLYENNLFIVEQKRPIILKEFQEINK